MKFVFSFISFRFVSFLRIELDIKNIIYISFVAFVRLPAPVFRPERGLFQMWSRHMAAGHSHQVVIYQDRDLFAFLFPVETLASCYSFLVLDAAPTRGAKGRGLHLRVKLYVAELSNRPCC